MDGGASTTMWVKGKGVVNEPRPNNPKNGPVKEHVCCCLVRDPSVHVGGSLSAHLTAVQAPLWACMLTRSMISRRSFAKQRYTHIPLAHTRTCRVSPMPSPSNEWAMPSRQVLREPYTLPTIILLSMRRRF